MKSHTATKFSQFITKQLICILVSGMILLSLVVLSIPSTTTEPSATTPIEGPNNDDEDPAYESYESIIPQSGTR